MYLDRSGIIKTVVIGGGPSGVVSAIFASRNGEDVIVLERNDKVLKKLLITGNGRCNYFNEDFSSDYYYSSDNDLICDVINDINRDMYLSFFDSLGIVPFVKNGCYYPYSQRASSVREILLDEINRSGVNVITSCYVSKIEKDNDTDCFKVFYNDEVLVCDRVILSCGSRAYPKTGSDGNGYDLLSNFGHTINMVYPALTRLVGNESYFKKWDGVRSEVVVSLYENGNLVSTQCGEVQFTKTGISGICVFNLSNIASKGILLGNDEVVKINFMPFLDYDVDDWFDSRDSEKRVFTVLEGFLNYKLIDIILDRCGISGDAVWGELSFKNKSDLISFLTEFTFVVKGTGMYDVSQVCGGGVSLCEVDLSTMESKVVSGLYITGELLDLVGDCGGYNLSFAFISGILAGRRGIYD